MMNAYEQRLIAFYLANAAAFLRHHDPEASELAEWVADRDNRAAFGHRRKRLRRRSIEPDEGMSGRKWRALRETLREQSSATSRARLDRTAQRLRRLARTTDLSRTDVAILELLLRYRTQPVIESMLDDVFGGGRIHALNVMNVRSPALPAVLGLSPNTIQRRFRKEAPLVRAGLVTVDGDGDLSAVGRLTRLASAPGGAGLDVNHLLLDPAPRSDLDWSDFDHLARDRDHVERILAGALGSGVSGVNVLLYGPPGTGKTEFCKVLAERLGASLFSVGESDDDGDEPVRGERLQELRLAQRLLARDRGSLLLFDEMEDLLSGPSFGLASLFGPSFSSGFRERGSKVFMHRMLEEAPTPTLWTMNDPGWASDTILRRMMFALEMRPPAPAVKARIWARQLDQHGIEASADDARSLAREFAANPGVAAGATAAARSAAEASPTSAAGCGAFRGCSDASGRRRSRRSGSTSRSSRPTPARPSSPAASGASPTAASRSACKGRPGRARARSSATSPSASGSRSFRSGPPTSCRCGSGRQSSRLRRRSPKRATPGPSSSSTRRIRCSPIGASPRGRGRSARSTRC